MSDEKIIIGSRKSTLAKIQAFNVANKIHQKHPQLNIEFLFTSSVGDDHQNKDLTNMGTVGVFTKDLHTKLVNKDCDIAVHSWKDLPIDTGVDTFVAGTLNREDPRDLLLIKHDSLNKSSYNIASSSPRRIFNLEKFPAKYLPNFKSPDGEKPREFSFSAIRGNILTRVNKVLAKENNFDGIIIAKAAIDRLINIEFLNSFNDMQFGENHQNKYQDNIAKIQTEKQELVTALKKFWLCVLPLEINPPAAGQGSLAIELRRTDTATIKIIESINAQDCFSDVNIERENFKQFGGGCFQKIGCYFNSGSWCANSNNVSKEKLGIKITKGLDIDNKPINIYHSQKLVNRSTIKLSNPWPKASKQYPKLFKRVEIDKSETSEKLQAEDNIIVSRINSLPDWLINQLDENPQATWIWSAGNKTWQKLAAKGVWVNGSFESLGEDINKLPNNLLHELKLTGDKQNLIWKKLTHSSNQISLNKNTPTNSPAIKMVATYNLDKISNPISNETAKEMKNADCIFWMSGSGFEYALQLIPELKTKHHACGPGNTYQTIINHIPADNIHLFLNFDDWQASIT